MRILQKLLRSRINTETKSRTLPHCALHPNASAMRIHDMPCNRSPESSSARLTRSSRVHPVEPLEDAPQVGLRNSYARVRNRKDDFAAIRICGHIDSPARWSVLQRVIHKILQNLA